MNSMLSKIHLTFSLILLSFSVSAQPADWVEVASGVWKCTTGEPDILNLFNAADIKPATDALDRMEKVPFPLPAEKIAIEKVNSHINLRFPLKRDEQIFGFGLNFKSVYQRGKILQLHVDHYGGTDNGRTHAPVPFYVSGNGYGVFVNSSRYLTVYAGTGVRKGDPEAPEELDRNSDPDWTAQPYSDAVEILVPSGGVEVYIFAGPTPLDAIRRYILYCGGGPLPPRWGLGFTQRVPTLYTSDQVVQEAREFEEQGFPLDFIGLEPGWQSRSYPCSLEWDSSRYPDPVGFVRIMKSMGIRINLWTNPYISSKSSLYPEILQFTGSHTVWGGVVADLTIPEARKVFNNHINTYLLSMGIDGFKIDETDGYDRWLWPDVATFPSGNDAEQLRQTYGLFVQRMTTQLFRSLNNRTWGLTRSSNGGGSSFPYVIYNDYYSHEDFITALINSGFSGVLWTPEVRSSKTGEEWLRRFQTVCFSPMAMINAWASGTKPWSFEDVKESVRNYALLRMQLIPYFYSEFAKYHFEGIPPFRGMSLESGFEMLPITAAGNKDISDDPYQEAVRKEIKDQYMAGGNLLVAPLFTGQKSRQVILPKGRWYDFYTGDYVGDGETITVSPGIEKIPVYVKDGGIIPMTKPAMHATAAGEKYDLEIRYYGTRPGKYLLYDDDGETFDYEKGVYSWREITVQPDRNGNLSGKISKAEKGKPDNIGKVTWRFMSK
jgi:alpha-glucosidase (family GH31 glycosyl hydrolase)